MKDHGYYQSDMDFWLEKAIHDIKKNYGHEVSIWEKGKDLLKFGRSEAVQTGTKTTLMTLPSGVYNETYASDNVITHVSSSSGSDTVEIVVEGHTISGGNLTFVSQTVTLAGQTKTALTTPMARANRAYNDSGTDLVGNIYFYHDTAITAGIPNDLSTVHLMIRAGENNTEKCATSISSADYWIITGVYADVIEKTASTAEIVFESRVIGKVFREAFELTASNTSGTYRQGHPYVIVRPNSDVRLRALASAANTQVSGGIVGVLAKII